MKKVILLTIFLAHTGIAYATSYKVPTENTQPTPESSLSTKTTKIVIASNNKGKLRELQKILDETLSSKTIVVEPMPQGIESPEETGTTFVENAIIKARYIAKITGSPTIADDSGLEVDALNGQPGVYSARYAGENTSNKEKMEKLLGELKNVPKGKRQARFKSVLVFLRHADDPSPIIAEGTWNGEITFELIGDKGFGYDPIFWVPEHNCTAAQLSPEAKNAISHRGIALKKLTAKLKELYRQ